MKIGKKQHYAQGSALIMTLLAAMIIGVTMASYLTLVSSQNRSTMRAQGWDACLPIVEGGIDEALTQINYNGTNNLLANGWLSTNGVYVKQRQLPDGYYVVSIQPATQPVIVSSGYVAAPLNGTSQMGIIGSTSTDPNQSQAGYLKRTVRVTAVKSSGSNGGGLSAKGKITFSGGGSLDSYDSSLGPYSPLTRRANGIAVSNLGVLDAIHVDTAYVYGKATTAAGGTVTINSSTGKLGDLTWNASHTGIQAGHTSSDANLEFPDVAVPFTSGYFVPGSGKVNGTNYDYVVGAGNNQLGAINIGGGKSMIVTGNAVLNMTGDFVTSGSGFVYIAPGASLKLYIKTKFKVSGTGVVNGTQSPDKFTVYGLNTATEVTYSGSSEFIGTVYAPYAPFTFSGSAGAFGAFTANTIDITGGAAVHFDEHLNGGTAKGYQVASWDEI